MNIMNLAFLGLNHLLSKHFICPLTMPRFMQTPVLKLNMTGCLFLTKPSLLGEINTCPNKSNHVENAIMILQTGHCVSQRSHD